MASQQWRRLPNANPYCDANAYSDCDANTHSDRDADAYSDCDANAYSDCDANTHSDRDANTHGDPASADAKAAAYAVSSADSVSEWVKELQQK
jgi:hypothetical protein